MKKITLGLLALIFSTQAFAGVPYAFVSGTPAVASEVNANFNFLDLAISDLQTEQSTQDADISSNADDISTLQTDLFTLNLFATGTSNDLSSLSTTVSTQGTSLASLSTTVSGHTTSITSLQSSVSTITTDVSSAETAITTLQSDVSTLDAVVTANTDDLSLLESAVSSIETSIASIQSAITSIQTAIGTLETDTADLDTRVSTLESAPGAGCPAQSGEWYMDYLSYSYIPNIPGDTYHFFKEWTEGMLETHKFRKIPIFDATTGKHYVLTIPIAISGASAEITLTNLARSRSEEHCFNDLNINGYGVKFKMPFRTDISTGDWGHTTYIDYPVLIIKLNESAFLEIQVGEFNFQSVTTNYPGNIAPDDGSTVDMSLTLDTTAFGYLNDFIDYITVEEVTP